MKKIVFLFVSVFLSMMSYTQELTSEEKLLLKKLDKDYSNDHYGVSLTYAWLLYRTGEEKNYIKADSVLNQVISIQDHDPESLTYGQWGWEWKDGEKTVDYNNALFQAHIMFAGLWNEQGKMSPKTRTSFITSCNELVEAAKRRWDYEVFDIYRDFKAYSNIFAMYVQTFFLAADRFNSPRLLKLAKGQWIRWYNHISFFGIDEFASPGYNNVVFKAVLDIRDFCHDERIQKEASEVLDHIYLLQSVLTHPLLKIPVTGVSRDYRNFTTPGDVRSEILIKSVSDIYTPPLQSVELNRNRKYPFEVIGKASMNPFIFRSYQLEDAAMGSMTGGACYEQQIHCIAAVGKNENERAVVFLQGAFTPVNGYSDQIGTSCLCIYNRLPSYWHFTQWRGDMSVYKETFDDFGVGITQNWKEKLKTRDHIILEAYGYEVHIFPFKIKGEKIASCDLELKHRTGTSPRYHPCPRVYDEYVFPEEPDWFGAYITFVKSETEVEKPKIRYELEEGVRTFITDKGHQVRLFVTEKGDTRQIFNTDPAFIPLLKIIK